MLSSPFHFPSYHVPPETEGLREEVREFLAEMSSHWSGWDIGHSWTGFNREFSREVGKRGWIGMAWSKAYGGHERSVVERYVVVEEMLAAGAPVGAHWVADRQSGPLILRHGNEAQKQTLLPRIARGEAAFCIGLSEPDSGSDLASLRARAEKVSDGWLLNGRKIWTTYARECDFMIGLFRSSGSPEQKQKGLSQFLIDLTVPGIEINPIRDLTGESHFNEIVFDNVLLPEDSLVGEEGNGWAQVNAELAYERSGPDRYLSSYPLLPAAIDALNENTMDRLSARAVGLAFTDITVLREMSLSILNQLGEGKTPLQEAAVTKLLGTELEQDMPELVRSLLDCSPSIDPHHTLSHMQGYLTQSVPSFSLRGGTNEIMRGIIARGLGLR
ncbi:acyl-CoA dehydrogenase [Aestuariicella hydrocarbonica]|uniref:Acyl-CoA dehydrogenase n=1 Tax=Pseudomaricurvus hydrocarbonicus TaxID=1470433 RepID=A0A9E5MKK0_9GAMM|nr:acyl-CoA dehydrogenase family protein [Aestuariicella hydrocarbonica]NHO66639.1 acyl-CoA dehydrogenase [Aestuariicella hydrocarbonica]